MLSPASTYEEPKFEDSMTKLSPEEEAAVKVEPVGNSSDKGSPDIFVA